MGCSSEIVYTNELVVDENIYRGENGEISDCVIVWVDVLEDKYNSDFEYGLCLYDSTKTFNPNSNNLTVAENGKQSFGVSINAGILKKGIKWGVKAYVKEQNEIRYSETTVYFET